MLRIAYPGEAVPFVGGLLGEANAPGGSLSPEFDNQLGAMHGTIIKIWRSLIVESLLIGDW
jgi:cytochrome c oxidase subunit 1